MGMRTYGDGSACKATGKTSCALWGNSALDICVDNRLLSLKDCFGYARRSEVSIDCKCVVIEVLRTTNVPAGSAYGAATLGTVRIYVSEGDHDLLSADDFIWEGRTLELPYNNNERDSSSVPATSFTPYADYDATTTFSDGQFIIDGDLNTPENAEIFYNAIRLGSSNTGLHAGEGLYLVDNSWSGGDRNVIDRSGIKFHLGNHAGDTSGCIIIGDDVVVDSQGARLMQGSTAATQEFYEVIDEYVNSGYPIRVKMTQTTGSSTHFQASDVSQSALSELEEATTVSSDGSFELDVDISGTIQTSATCEVSQPLKDFLNECWENILGGLVIVIKFTIPLPACISADTMIQTRERGNATAGTIEKGQMIAGRNGTEADSWCTVVSHTRHGTGYVSGNFTPDHFLVEIVNDGENQIVTNGKSHPPRLASLVNIVTDCDMAQTMDGQLFTPFSTSFCPELSWTNYLQVLGAIRTLTREERLSFLWDPKSWHDNASHPFYPAIRRLCSSIVACVHEEACAQFEDTVAKMLESNLEPTKKQLVTSVWPSSGDMAASIQHMSIHGSNVVSSSSADSPLSWYATKMITSILCALLPLCTVI